MVPYDDKSPMVTSGIRIGTPAITTRGLREHDMEVVADFIDRTLMHRHDSAEIAQVRAAVNAFMHERPLFAGSASLAHV